MSENLDQLKRGYEAYGRGDLESAMESWADDIRWEGSNSTELPGGGSRQGKESIAAGLADFAGAFDSVSVTPDEFHDDGDTVIVLGHTEGRLKSGREIKLPFVHIWRFEGGKAKRVQLLTDTLEFAQAAGIA